MNFPLTDTPRVLHARERREHMLEQADREAEAGTLDDVDSFADWIYGEVIHQEPSSTALLWASLMRLQPESIAEARVVDLVRATGPDMPADLRVAVLDELWKRRLAQAEASGAIERRRSDIVAVYREEGVL